MIALYNKCSKAVNNKDAYNVHMCMNVFTCVYVYVGLHMSITHPSVVMVTMVYQKEAGMLVNLLELDPFSA